MKLKKVDLRTSSKSICSSIKFQNNYAFTLVELIVVVTILAILATIGFVSYSSYLTGVRDTNRLSQLVSISDGLELYSTRKTLPIPDDSVEVNVTVASTDYLIGYQGVAGFNTLESIDFTKGGKDPKDDTFFAYALTKDRKNFQMTAFLEEAQEGVETTSYQLDTGTYDNRVAANYGKTLGMIFTQNDLPIHEDATIAGNGGITLNGIGDDFTTIAGNGTVLTGNSPDILYGAYVEMVGRGKGSCKEILQKHPYIQGTDGPFWISTQTDILKLPCDMTIDGGGRTMVLHGNDSDIAKYDSRGANSWSNSNTFIPFTATGSTHKLTDSTINAVRGEGSYMTTATRATDSNIYKYYTPETCDYDHELANNGTCASELYKQPDHTVPANCSPDASWAGISCWTPTSAFTEGIVTNNISQLSNAVCFNPWAGCTNQGLGSEVKMYVR